MLLSDLIVDLRIDLSDLDASLFQDNTLERCVRKAVYKLSRDAKLTLSISGDDIAPDPEGEIRELLLLLGTDPRLSGNALRHGQRLLLFQRR